MITQAPDDLTAVTERSHVKPFIRSMNDTFNMMLMCPVECSSAFELAEKPSYSGISGVVTLSGKAHATIVLNLPPELAMSTAEMMLGRPCDSLDPDVKDAVGELINMVSGAAKSNMPEYSLKASLPNVISGDPHCVAFSADAQPVRVLFDSEWGQAIVDIAFAEESEDSVRSLIKEKFRQAQLRRQERGES